MVSHSSAGGAQEIWVNLAEQFKARGYDVTLVALYPLRSDIRKTPDTLPWTYVAQRQPRTPVDAMRLFWSLIAMIRRQKPDFVLTALPAANVAAALAARLAGTGTKVITSHHAPVSTNSKLLDTLDGLTGRLRSVQTVICVSDFVKSSLSGKSASYRAKAKTIKNALPPDVEGSLVSLAVPESERQERRVVATGRLAYQKNYPVLLAAAQHLRNADVTIVGGGPDEQQLKAMAAENKVQDRVTFVGHVARTEALSILSTARVFVQPSRFEGHSLALIEAAKLGLPLVVSDVPVQIEGITANDGTRCGIAVGLDDDRKLAEEIQRLLDDDDYHAKWSGAARRLASDVTFDKMMVSYQQLVS